MKSKLPTQLLSILLIIILLLGAQNTSLTAQESIDKNQTLYVGGTGPNNYTSIQTAINEAQAQDTIYVYNGMYQEAIHIEKEITLLGESTENVILQAPQNENQNGTIEIFTNNVNINKLTIGSNGYLFIGKDNGILENIEIGNIYFSSEIGYIIGNKCNNVLVNNCSTSQTSHYSSFAFFDSTNISIISNKLYSTEIVSQILFSKSANINIIGNTVEALSYTNSTGIFTHYSTDIKVIGNTITAFTGLESYDNKNIEVKNNNFIYCDTPITHTSPLRKAKFDSNYYGEARKLPMLIFGNPFGLRVDWRPRSQPYDLPLITMQTNHGSMILELYSEEMPITSQNFMDLTKINFFDGIVFHRVLDDFVIQGGGFDQNGDYYESPYGEIPFESHPDIVHVDGAISMARTNDPDSATSQFFICDGRQKYLDDEYQMQNNDLHGYAAFGALVSGFDVLRDIASVETERKHMMDDWPVEEVIITYARLAE